MSTPPFKILDPMQRLQSLHGRCAFAVMAKAPVPGKVKTRLSPPLTPTEAALLNAAFLRDTLASLGAAAQQSAASCVVSYTPAGQESAFIGILPEHTLLLPQRGDGFGERLSATANDLFLCGFSAVCLIDSDSPTVPTAEYVRAAEILLGSAGGQVAVLGRSEDGGYYLLGLAQPQPRLFEEITWSTAHVADETEQRAHEAGVQLIHLARWYDVDDAHSLDRLQRELAGDPLVPRGYEAPHTRQLLQTLESLAPVHGGPREEDVPHARG
ncbi:TIGR04282 family arsenosugar biosynthesis glycosyltransferase [Acidipila sp. EB88]|uniref:TIGR04282 family arsenosugar biosynthesis glycosyltransferase n=1 Tax=Acidipila sp. EB88 TaxID=2305226 RepID=UPI000F5F09A3|nr:TIGR04282 family arsenosugar biosynthesis glycosyltransferase [Acidipila sp. EB88]RRA48141.1 glycosyltransferase [Acidipila sp. EB88]